jgi:hypothetical protein
VRLSEFDPVFTATAAPRCVLSFKVSGNHRDKLHGEERVEGNWNLGGGGEFRYFIASGKYADQTHCSLISPSRESSLRGCSTVALGWTQVLSLTNENRFTLTALALSLVSGSTLRTKSVGPVRNGSFCHFICRLPLAVC